MPPRSHERGGADVFAPLSLKPRYRTLEAVADIETWGLDASPDAFAIGVVYEPSLRPATGQGRRSDLALPAGGFYLVEGTTLPDGTRIEPIDSAGVGFVNRDGMREFITAASRFNRGGRVYWGHNAGRYDWYSFFDSFYEAFGVDGLTAAGGRFIEGRLRVGKHGTKAQTLIRYRDSTNLFRTSCAKLGDALGRPKGITPRKFKEARREAGLATGDFVYCLGLCNRLRLPS